MTSDALGSTCFCLSIQRSQAYTAMPRFSVGAGDMNSAPHVFTASDGTESPLQPLFPSYFKLTFIYLWGGAHMP